MKRTHYCGELNLKNVNQKVILCGWVHTRRDHGGVIFIDLRDREGIVQVVFRPEEKDLFIRAEKIRSEYVLQIEGNVSSRPDGTKNPKLPTGEVEIIVEKMEILNTSEVPPFEISSFSVAGEELRLKYRYLDLRRKKLKDNLIIRHKLSHTVRKLLSGEGFIEIETPFLTKSTPEGARDFLVPSRLNPGTFYALPQSPQLFKQILMVSGVDRYFQVVRCFRDEDLRADRQPEFTQIDIEMSFVDEEDVIATVEKLLSVLMRDILGVEIKTPFARMDYEYAINTYGTDKPDLRYRDVMKITDVSAVVAGSGFKIFSEAVKAGGCVKCVSVPPAVDGKAGFSRSAIDELTKFATGLGAKGLAWLNNSSPIKRFFSDGEIKNIYSVIGYNREGTQPDPAAPMVFFIADKKETANAVLGALRTEIINRLKIKPVLEYEFVWVVNFPLFEWSEEEKRFVSMHHPFTQPVDEKMLDGDLSKVAARAYDIVLNGTELGGGSIRIHRTDLQEKIFSILKISGSEAKDRFGFLLEALKFGAPPHGGIALGFDRLCAILCGEESIRDVIAFPKTQKGICPLTGAPDAVSSKQLKELSIEVKDGEK
ncbi:MAG: aspartate--tRNA ligase [Elusimicrobia bacterium]|nr:aspartate--tRNA ligase [Elusimicrobiota bacterium]